MGAWVEMRIIWIQGIVRQVAPYVGAWVEIRRMAQDYAGYRSHPMWVRGLKFDGAGVAGEVAASHPMWVRGLK